MKKQVQSFFRYLTLPCLLSTLSLSADDMDSSDMGQTYKSTDHFVSTYDRLKGKEITPNAGPAVSGGVDANVQADYIYWYVSQDGLDYALSGFSTGDNPQNDGLVQGRQYNPGKRPSSGFKVGLGLDFAYDGWDLGLTYTWLHNSHSSDADIENGPFWTRAGNFYVGGEWLTPPEAVFSNNLATGAFSEWNFRFNVFDLELGRAFFLSPKIVMRPHFGLKGTWQSKSEDIWYAISGSAINIGLNPTGTEFSATESYTIENRQHYWGFGPRAGLDTSWMITKEFSFFGECAVSTLWGYFKNTREDETTVVDVATNANVLNKGAVVNSVARKHQVNPVLEMQIGFRYDYMFSDDEYRFRVQAGWENQVWFNQIGSAQGNDLGLQGLTLNFRFDF